jgi:hypothetical protein
MQSRNFCSDQRPYIPTLFDGETILASFRQSSVDPTERERKAILKCGPRLDTQLTPQVTVRAKGEISDISLNHPEPAVGQLLIMEALGSG